MALCRCRISLALEFPCNRAFSSSISNRGDNEHLYSSLTAKADATVDHPKVMENMTTTNFLSLPYEIRSEIYAQAFGKSNKGVLSTSRLDSDALLLLPTPEAGQQYSCPRSGQLLRVCRAIYEEAIQILYSQTTFHTMSHLFAGKMPTAFATENHPFSAHVKHLIWQVDCDMMKHLYIEDLQLMKEEFANLQTLEIRARAETWRDSFLGEECDRERFVKGREQTIQYAKILRELMRDPADEDETVKVIEDRTFLGRGCVRVRLDRAGGRWRSRRGLSANVSPKC
jgi:hypothetical protein